MSAGIAKFHSSHESHDFIRILATLAALYPTADVDCKGAHTPHRDGKKEGRPFTRGARSEACARSAISTGSSAAEEELHDVAILDGVPLAFRPQQTEVVQLLEAAVIPHLLEGSHVGSNEPVLHIRMNLARRLWCTST